LTTGEFLRRCRDQPRGYAGDHLTIQMMYDGIATSGSVFGNANHDFGDRDHIFGK